MSIHRLLSITLLLITSCNQSDTGPNQDGDGDADDQAEETGMMPDLPCGGADLLTDNYNCGACSNECDVIWPYTQYAAGLCVDGKCGPRWAGFLPLLPPPDTLTCDDVCSAGDLECAPRGCSGLTGVVCVNLGDFGTQCDLAFNAARIEISSNCDEPAPYPNDVEPGDHVYLDCCCEHP